MTANLYPDIQIGVPAGRLNGKLGVLTLGAGTSYIGFDSPDDALVLIRELAKVVRLMDPGPADDLLFEAVADPEVLARIPEIEEAPAASISNAASRLLAALDEPELPPWCSPGPPCAATGPGPAAHPYLICNAAPGHSGDHVLYNSGGEVLAAWPQEPAPECNSCHAASEPLHVVHVSHEGRQVRIYLCQDKDACGQRRIRLHGLTGESAPLARLADDQPPVRA